MPNSSKAKIHSISEGRNRNQPRPQPGQRQQKEAPSQQPVTSVHPVEPQDKKATGTTGAQQIDALRQNAEAGQARQHPETAAGQHATGSFTTTTQDKRGKR